MGPVGVSRSRYSVWTIIAVASVGDDTGRTAREAGMKTIRWGVLGAARIARTKVVPAMQRAAGCEVVALASRSLDLARATAESLGIPRAHGSYEALLADPGIDAVY